MVVSSGKYERLGKVYAQTEPVRVLLVCSSSEIGYWSKLFMQMTTYFKKEKKADIDIVLVPTINPLQGIRIVDAVYGEKFHVVISRLNISYTLGDGDASCNILDFLQRMYDQIRVRRDKEAIELFYPPVVLFDNMDPSISRSLEMTFAHELREGAMIEFFCTSTPEEAKELIRCVSRIVMRMLDSRFRPYGS